jgi:hypothetical protein
MKKPITRQKAKVEIVKSGKLKKNNLFGKCISFIMKSATIRVKLITAFLVPIAFITHVLK